MDINTAILTRRSIRKYTPIEINDETLRKILNAGFHAPTAGNKRPVHFVVVKDKELLQTLSKAKAEAEMIGNAEVAIVICGDKNVQWYNDFLHEDCAASIQNMLLCIHSLGLGAVWCGVPEVMSDCFKVYIDNLHLPEHIVPVATIAIGGIGEEKPYIDRFDETKVHYDRW